MTVPTFMPGRRTSRPNCVVPLTLSAVSIRRIGLPMSEKSLRSFSLTSGGCGNLAAALASSPNPSERPEEECVTLPRAAAQVAGSTFQRAAAAAKSIVRATAPASRKIFQLPRVLVEPPVAWRCKIGLP